MFKLTHPLFQSDNPAGGGAGTEPPTDPGKQPGSDAFPSSWEDVFKHPRFKELNTRAQTAEQQLKEIQAAEKQKNDEALKEQNKWKELYEGSQKELSSTKTGYLRLKVLTSKILPDESKGYLNLIDRLQGENEDDIVKDVDGLLDLFKQPESKGIPSRRRQGEPATFDFQAETDPKKIREAVRQGQK
jgi:hypothetical protein